MRLTAIFLILAIVVCVMIQDSEQFFHRGWYGRRGYGRRRCRTTTTSSTTSTTTSAQNGRRRREIINTTPFSVEPREFKMQLY
ncbi:hypothetical protein PUN28_015393 [Cardiocondyla obscurior]|uniref:Uncharacterized protein n=1 Tax=Cardiocondyla obscurior TaxID=286306 RepID=A0AAW2EY27_9HYME